MHIVVAGDDMFSYSIDRTGFSSILALGWAPSIRATNACASIAI